MSVLIAISSISNLQAVLRLDLLGIDLTNHKRITFDFSNCRFGKPLAMLTFGHQLRRLRAANPEVEFYARTTSNKFRSYADDIGFFDYCGISRGLMVNAGRQSENCIPITKIDIDNLKSQSELEGVYAEVAIEKSRALTQTLLHSNNNGDLFRVISYSLREALRNCLEHSLGTNIYYAAQYFRNENRAELALFDDGIGVGESLRSAGITKSSTLSYLATALKPGVTGVSTFERSLQPEEYRNSGFGLYVLSRYFAENGEFTIQSGGSGITLKGNNTYDFETDFSGTCIGLTVDFRDTPPSAQRILEIVAEGEGRSSTPHPASPLSKNLELFANR